MNEVKDKTYNNTRISLENMKYETCTFINCKIEFSGEGKTGLIGCNFDNCQWVFVGAAQNTLSFMHMMYHEFGDFGKAMIEKTFENLITTPVEK